MNEKVEQASVYTSVKGMFEGLPIMVSAVGPLGGERE